jgi:hypothetical protein
MKSNIEINNITHKNQIGEGRSAPKNIITIHPIKNNI